MRQNEDLIKGNQNVGSYASIGVNGFDFSLSKNHISPIWLTLFREDDKKIMKVLDEDNEERLICEYKTTVMNPEVVDFYSFMDFNATNASGSASSLVSYVKAFIGSGLRNKIIAIFDNDTAAHEALSILKKIDIPDNIKIFTYPDLEYTKNYPTLGPYGIVSTDINGLACSIELFLGIDLLKDENEILIPVQWKGYNQLLKKYQGEILNKEKIIQRYFMLLDDIEKEENIPINHDWYGMHSILNMIYKAF
jgi:hypothetical protein